MEISKIELGKYEEPTRLYLRGQGEFPPNTLVFVTVSSLQDVWLMPTFPATRTFEGYKSHSFSVPGIHFDVQVGAKGLTDRKELCIRSGSVKPILYSKLEDLENAKRLARQRLALAQSVRTLPS